MKMDNSGPPTKRGFRERFLAPIRSRTRPTSPSLTSTPPASAVLAVTPPTVAAPVASTRPAPSSSLPLTLLPSTSSNHTRSSTSEYLLQASLQCLSDQNRTLIQRYISFTTDADAALDQVIQAALTQQQQCQDKRWTFTLGSRTVTLREEADKVVHWLNRFKSVGDIASNVDPVHVGLPWAGVRLLLEVTVVDANQRASLLVGCELALYMSNRLKVYTDFYHRLPQTQARLVFRDALVQVYACILQFLAQAIEIYHSSFTHRITRAFWEVGAITDFETRCDDLAMRIEVEASNCDRVLYQRHTQQVINEIQRLHRVQESLDRIEAKIDLDKLNRLPYVASAEFNAYEADRETTCHPGTRLDVLRQIMDWAHQPDSKRIFWLNGMAGTGKSTVSYTFAGQLLDQANSAPLTQLGASFFFKRGEDGRHSAKRLFPTVARRLAYQLPALGPLIVGVISDEPDIGEKKLGEQFEKLIYRPLQTLSSSTNGIGDSLTLIVVVDALDECDRYEDIKTLLKLWPRLSQITGIQLKLFLTGRPDISVLQGLDSMPVGVRRDMILHDIPQTEITKDITLYLKDRLSKAQGHTFPGSLDSDWPSEEDLQMLLKLTVPFFIAAATACRFIIGNSRFNPQARLQILIKARSTHHLSEIEELYVTVLKQLTASCVEPDDEEIVYREFRIIVGTIVIVANPLSPRSLARLLQLDLGDVQRCLHTLHSVLYVPSNPDTTVRYLHLSFCEFLLSAKSQSRPYGINEMDAHRTLLTYCLDLLNSRHGLKENTCEMEFPGQPRQDLNSSIITRFLPAEIQYACQHWVYHAQQGMVTIHDNDQVHCFLQKHFLHWFEALSIMGRSTAIIRYISGLQSIVMNHDNEAVSAFLEDARRFTLSHRYIVDLAPLQLYSSAKIFSPQASVVRKVCGRAPSWISKLPLVPSRWSPELQKLEGHAAKVDAVSFSPDGQLLASASADRSIRMWDVSTGQGLQTLDGAADPIKAIAFFPNGQLLALSEQTIKVWDTSMGQEVQMLERQTDLAKVVAISSDGQLLALALDNRTVRIWDTSKGQEVQMLETYTGFVRAIAFSLKAQLLVLVLTDRTARVWNTSTEQEVQMLEKHTDFTGAVALSPNGQLLALALYDRTARIWDVSTKKEVCILNGHTSWINTVAFSPNGQLLASASDDRTVRLWNTSTGQELQTLKGHTDCVNTVTFSPDGEKLASAGWDRTIKLWDTSIGQKVEKLEGHTDYISAVAFSPNGQLLASAAWDQTVRMWDASAGQEVQKLEGHTDEVSAVAFSPDGQLLASAGVDETVRVWNIGKGQKAQKLEALKLEGHTDCVAAVAFSPDGQLLASAAWDETVRVWDMRKGQEVYKLEGHTIGVSAVAFSPDGQLLASAAWDETVRVWDMRKGQEAHKLEGHTKGVSAVAFSPNGQLLASASTDLTVRVWDVSTGQEAQRFNLYVSQIAFSDDGMFLLTDRGPLSLNTTPVSQTTSEPRSQQQSKISPDDAWIQCDGRNLLWLPHEYRRAASAVYGHTIAFGLASGRVSFIQLDPSQLPLSWSTERTEK